MPSFVLPIASDVGLKPRAAELLIDQAGQVERVPAEARHRLGHLVARAQALPAVRGPVEIRATVSGLAEEVRVGSGAVDEGGIHVEAPADERGSAVAESAGWLVSRSADQLRQSYERAWRRVQPLASRFLEVTPRRLRTPLLNATRFLRR